MWWSGSFFGMSFLWWLFWIILIVAFFAMVTPVPRRHARRTRVSALDILQRRYAAGELSTAEYEERRAILLRDRELPPTAPAQRAATTTSERPVPPRPTVPQPQ
jgi:putative membrane protein